MGRSDDGRMRGVTVMSALLDQFGRSIEYLRVSLTFSPVQRSNTVTPRSWGTNMYRFMRT